MRRVTNPNGDFQFVGLKPGTWTVSLRPSGPPDNATVVQDGFTFELGPGDDGDAQFRIEQRIRRMRMLAPMRVSGDARCQIPIGPAPCCIQYVGVFEYSVLHQVQTPSGELCLAESSHAGVG